jgi:pimeloyl-ACP methyl ester carboxylesterase
MSDLFRLDTGSGDPVVLLHSGFLDHGMWAAQIPALAATHRVIAPDARGHGRSPVATAPFRHTDDPAELLDELGTGPAVLIGVSMGAATAVDTALEHPALVRALVLTGAGTSEPYFTDPWTVRAFGAWTGAMAVPVLAVHGGVDSPDHIGMAQRVVDEVRDGRAVTVEGAAHYPMVERPGRYTELITGFLTEIDR